MFLIIKPSLNEFCKLDIPIDFKRKNHISIIYMRIRSVTNGLSNFHKVKKKSGAWKTFPN